MDRAIKIENAGYITHDEFSTFIKMLVEKMQEEKANKNKNK